MQKNIKVLQHLFVSILQIELQKNRNSYHVLEWFYWKIRPIYNGAFFKRLFVEIYGVHCWGCLDNEMFQK